MKTIPRNQVPFRACHHATRTHVTRCPFHKFLASFFDLTLVRPWGIQVALKLVRPWTKPRSTFPLLAARLTERSPSHQRCPSISPRVRMGVAAVIVVDKGEQPGLEVRHRTEVTLLQESP